MERVQQAERSLGDVHQSVDTRTGSRWKRIASFIGPAYLISVGYMDPGNWATDLAGGSRYGYALIWVLLMSNLMALLLQSLSARLGIIRGRDLAQCNRETYPASVNFILYILAEIAIAATDLAEVLGMAIGLQLLTGLPLLAGVLITLLDTLLIFVLQRMGIRKMEAFIIALIAVIGFALLWELVLARPHFGEVAGGFIPSIPDKEALYIAIGIIGATVMPHNLYLHSALVQTRKIRRDEAGIRQALRMNFADSAVALNLAFLVNAAILILAATAFFKNGRTDVAEIADAHKLLSPLLGSTLAPALFAVALIAAGQSSTVTGTLAGQIVMEGYLRLRINPWLRRLLTRLLALIPAVLTIVIFGENEVGELLVFSQVLLSLQLGFAVIPLIHFVSNKHTMGRHAIRLPLKLAAWVTTTLLVYLNLRMVVQEAFSYFALQDHWLVKILILAGGAGFVLLLLTTLLFPWFRGRWKPGSARIHIQHISLGDLARPRYQKIAIALDFSKNDEKVLSNAITQGNEKTTYVLIHVVESVSARMLGRESDDYESRQDQEQLNTYITLLKQRNIHAIGILGHYNRAKEIVRIVQEQKADLLVLGGHGHHGLKDWLYGETVNYVRHYVKIPVLIIN